MEELLSLKWNNHRSTFLHILGVLRDKQAYTDVTLACDGKFYSVHKLVLSTCSDYFCAMFDKTACKSPVIVLKDIKSEDLEALLDYMYLGEVNVRQSDLASLIKAAENLRIKGLAVPDDEPPKKGSVPASRTDSGRREGGSGSPPSKRKRRDEGEDGREDVRPPAPSTGGLHTPPPPSSRPKSPISQRLSSSPLRTSQESLMPEDRDSRPLSSPAESPVASHLTPHQSSQQLPHQSSQSSQPLPDQHEVSNQYRGEETPTFVKVEMEEETDDMQRDSYNMSGDGYKEENSGGDLGGDLSNDLPEFLQQAASGALASTSASYHHAFAGPSGFQPDVSGWQGDSQSLPGSFSGLGFQQPSSQDNPPGVASRNPRPREHLHLSTSEVAIARTLLTIPDQSTSRSSAAFVTSKASLQSSTAANSCSGSFTTSSSTLSPSTPQTLTVSLLKGSSCPECGKVFRGDYHKYNLKKHLTIHAGLRPFTCPVCNMSFNQKVSMKRHFASVHRALGQAQKVDQN
ncbi:longitudinals lacking protein, isoforms H/M/V-like isoform X4 [Portunus trituberculatus]|uniref:longitudinals lacking protein, isoforms H/M/V-like isoform X4 n=1 Tax=Portunus trituberculatus TaxID=210409 RepID=UPI001E1CF791|nr:longitudinals lacking protein, isoforms H/M/V-like isoform X4 [Portunus trituberculatus]